MNLEAKDYSKTKTTERFIQKNVHELLQKQSISQICLSPSKTYLLIVYEGVQCVSIKMFLISNFKIKNLDVQLDNQIYHNYSKVSFMNKNDEFIIWTLHSIFYYKLDGNKCSLMIKKDFSDIKIIMVAISQDDQTFYLCSQGFQVWRRDLRIEKNKDLNFISSINHNTTWNSISVSNNLIVVNQAKNLLILRNKNNNQWMITQKLKISAFIMISYLNFIQDSLIIADGQVIQWNYQRGKIIRKQFTNYKNNNDKIIKYNNGLMFKCVSFGSLECIKKESDGRFKIQRTFSEVDSKIIEVSQDGEMLIGIKNYSLILFQKFS